MIFFTGDTHYGHANVIKYANRPFQFVEEMDETMIQKWNAVVQKNDTVFHLGDISFYGAEKTREIVSRLKGIKYWIFGNHDKRLRKDVSLLSFFVDAKDYLEIKTEGQDIVLLHYAMRVWNASHYGSYHLYGHSHGTLLDDPNSLSFDVGVDSWNFYPVSFDQVVEKMKTKTFKPIDHHGTAKDRGTF